MTSAATTETKTEWQTLTSEERAWLEVVRVQRENLALRQQLLAQEEARIQAAIAARLGRPAEGLEVDLAGGRARPTVASRAREVHHG